jgi:hypothetical protein
MSSSLKFKKVYIDSKFKNTNSSSSSDFTIDLPETMYFDDNSSVFYIDDICIPHAWYTIEKDFNDKLYIKVVTPNIVSDYIISLYPGFYSGPTLAEMIQEAINDDPISPANMMIVTYMPKTNQLDFVLNPAAFNGGLPAGSGFFLLTPADLKTRLGGAFLGEYDPEKPQDCNEIIGNLEGGNIFHYHPNPMQRGQVNLQPIRNIYIHSSSLGNLSNIGPDGSQTVIKKIPVIAPPGDYIFDQTFIANDYNSCSYQTIKKLDFQLKTSKSDIINLHGHDISFSIVFSKGYVDA